MGGGLEIERVEKKRKIGKKIELTDQGTGIGEETKGIRRGRREEPVPVALSRSLNPRAIDRRRRAESSPSWLDAWRAQWPLSGGIFSGGRAFSLRRLSSTRSVELFMRHGSTFLLQSEGLCGVLCQFAAAPEAWTEYVRREAWASSEASAQNVQETMARTATRPLLFTCGLPRLRPVPLRAPRAAPRNAATHRPRTDHASRAASLPDGTHARPSHPLIRWRAAVLAGCCPADAPGMRFLDGSRQTLRFLSWAFPLAQCSSPVLPLRFHNCVGNTPEEHTIGC